jgi:hypothetical protein
MKYLILIGVITLSSCKSSKHTNCDAYSQNKEIKKDHQI